MAELTEKPAVFTADDTQFLLRAMNRNAVVLFLGAGFSHDATNHLGAQIPLSRHLAESLWGWLDFDGAYDGTSVGEMYQSALLSGRPFPAIASFIESNLLSNDVPTFYDPLTLVFWKRIYTTNVDDVLDRIWRRASSATLEVLRYPKDDVRERDQVLERIQAVYLHGKLPCRPDELTFTPRQYAQRAIVHDPLYDQFVRDYATNSVIFVGTELSEPLFLQYLEAREARARVPSEHRPRCFLITPKVSEPRRRNLADLNITAIAAQTRDFLNWLQSQAPQLGDREAVLKLTLPTYPALSNASKRPERTRDLGQFATAFHSVPLTLSATRRSTFLLGTTPLWEDILANLDAPRTLTPTLTQEVRDILDGDKKSHLFAILGSAGSGKSTILRRMGLMLAREGRPVYLTNSESLPRADIIARVLDSLGSRAVLLLDNAEGAIGLLPRISAELAKLENPPVLVVATRTNEFDRRIGRLGPECVLHEFRVEHLDDNEIRAVIARLEASNLLGQLRGMNAEQRFEQFASRANKQLLVAMREATTGKGFDDILRDEFKTLPTDESRILYLCAALATDAGYRIRKDELVGCARVKPAEAMYTIDRSLRDIVIATGAEGDLMLLRHRQIAEFMVDQAAPRDLLAVAYIRLLTVLSGEIGSTDRRSRTFLFYREIVNHFTIYRRFANEIDQARPIYDSLTGRLGSDPQFWLQFGALELEGGSLDLAENYLNQARSLDPNNPLILHSIGYLRLKQSLVAHDRVQALELRDEGGEMLLGAISSAPDRDLAPHPFHAYVSQRLGWIHRWSSGDEETKIELTHLREVVQEARTRFPRSYPIKKLSEDVEREYLGLAVRKIN